MPGSLDCVSVARTLRGDFAARAAAHDAGDTFVSEGYRQLKEHRLFSAGIPETLGGGGARYPELCHMLRELGSGCASTALCFSMHTHAVASRVWRFKHGDGAVRPLLERIAREQLVLVTSGGSDWLDSSGTARTAEGGFRVDARKVFASGSPAGDLLVTSAVHEDPQAGPTVLHFVLPFGTQGVSVEQTWRALGMRGTGSNDVLLSGVTVPAAAVETRRPKGQWHRFFDVISPVVWPLVMAVYVGVAEAARALALEHARRRRPDEAIQLAQGELETQLGTAQAMLEAMIGLVQEYEYEPSPERSNRTFMYKTAVTRAVLAVADRALEVAGGAGYYRQGTLERLFRDLQAVRYHPLQERRQALFSGRLALGMDPV